MSRPISIARICAAALLCGAEFVCAQSIYRQIDAAGHVTFSDREEARQSSMPNPSSSGVAPQVAVPRLLESWSDVTNALATRSPMSSSFAAIVDFNEAARRVQQVRHSRQDGIKALAGERTDAGGSSAMHSRYQKRQLALKRALNVAELRAQETSRIRRELAGRDGSPLTIRLAQP